LLAVLAIVLQLRIGEPDIIVEGAQDLTTGNIILEEVVRAGLATQLDQTGIIAGFRHQVNRPTHAIGAEAQRIAALEDFDVFSGQELQRLEIAEAVGIAVQEPVDQHVDATQVKVVSQTGTPNRELTLVGGPEARPDQHPRHKVEGIFQIGAARLFNLLGANDLRATRNTLDLLSGFFLSAQTVRDSPRGQWGSSDDHRRQRCRGLLRSDCGQA
jgi:hypothetical protein